MSRFTILITKKMELPAKVLWPGNENSTATDPVSDIRFIEKEFIRIEPVFNEPTKKEITDGINRSEDIAVIFTSKNAVKNTAAYFNLIENNNAAELFAGNEKNYALETSPSEDTRPANKIPAANFKRWNIFCIDGITKQLAAFYFGADRIAGSAKYAAELAECIVKNGKFAKALFFCGDKRRDVIPLLLPQYGINVDEIMVYRTIQTPVRIIERFDGVAFFSPSAAESFFSLNTLPEKTICFAIGATTASAIKKLTVNPVVVSSDTTEEKMTETIKDFFH